MKSQKQIETSIVIQAPKNQVWSVLTNLKEYKNWNPFIIKSTGQATLGSTLINTMKNGSKEMTFKPKVTKSIENDTFEWLGHLFIQGLFDGRHYFVLEEVDSQTTKLIQGEHFGGILSGMILKSIKEDTTNGFISMNKALKQQAENLAKLQ